MQSCTVFFYLLGRNGLEWSSLPCYFACIYLCCLIMEEINCLNWIFLLCLKDIRLIVFEVNKCFILYLAILKFAHLRTWHRRSSWSKIFAFSVGTILLGIAFDSSLQRRKPLTIASSLTSLATGYFCLQFWKIKTRFHQLLNNKAQQANDASMKHMKHI